MNNRQAIFNLIYEATGKCMAPCDMDEIIHLGHKDITRLIELNPNDEDLGRNIRQYCSERFVGKLGENADGHKTTA